MVGVTRRRIDYDASPDAPSAAEADADDRDHFLALAATAKDQGDHKAAAYYTGRADDIDRKWQQIAARRRGDQW